jgi:hypothetical protein
MIYYESYTLKKGARVLEGVVAPNFDNQPGGALQYFITGDFEAVLKPKALP